MLERFRARSRNRQVVDRLYEEIVRLSRQSSLFAEIGIPDTVMGRFESLSVHVFLFLARSRDEATLKPLAQDLVDRFMLDVEHSLRELGIGDLSVPKRMKKLAGMFYARVAAYDPPLFAGDAATLAAALAKYAGTNGLTDDAAPKLAAYMLEKKAEFDAVAAGEILAGRLLERN